MFRVTAQMMIKMMDKNDDGKIDNSEMSYDFDFEEYGFVTADVSKNYRSLRLKNLSDTWRCKINFYLLGTENC